MSNLNSRKLANLNAQISASNNNNKKNLFDWKPINNNLKLFTPNTNYLKRNNSGSSARSNSTNSRILKPLERSNSLRDLDSNNNNNNNNCNFDNDSKVNDFNLNLKLHEDEKQSSRGSSRTNFKRFDDLVDNYHEDLDERKSLVN